MASCSSCHYWMNDSVSPTGKPWCGWMGGEPVPGGDRCRFVPLEQIRVPEGLAIARSMRVVSVDQLAAENEAQSDAAGGGSWQGY